MRRRDPRRVAAFGLAAMVATLTFIGAAPAKKKKAEPPPKADETIGTVAQVIRTSTKLEGVGLVVGLDGTGSTPQPGYHRNKLVDEMRKAGVAQTEQLLDSRDISLVIVRVEVSTGVVPEDRFDVAVELPPGSGTTSLAGGRLMVTRLTPVMIGGGEVHEGAVSAKAEGPIMLGSVATPDDVKVGRVLGGGRSLREIPYTLALKTERKSVRTSNLVEKVIAARFFRRDGVNVKGMATAKSDQHLELKVPHVYHNDQTRYFQVIKLMPLIDTPNLRGERMEKWAKDLLDPKTSGISALRLEGLGPNSVPLLKAGLASPNQQVKFFSAEALSYLGDNSGVDVLADAVVHQPKFRRFALDALAATDESASYLKLRKLMDEPDVEVRYGAFDALRKIGDRDIGQVRVLDVEPEPEPEAGSDALAVQLGRARSKSRRKEPTPDPFDLYLVDSEGPPLIHLAQSRRCEVVIFGKGQTMLTPIVLGGSGPVLLNAADGDRRVEISRFGADQPGLGDAKVSSALAVGAVVREAANLGATYPEIVDILKAAAKQHNLPGPLVVDALPASDPAHDAALILGIDPSAKQDGEIKKAKLDESKKPGFFGRLMGRKGR